MEEIIKDLITYNWYSDEYFDNKYSLPFKKHKLEKINIDIIIKSIKENYKTANFELEKCILTYRNYMSNRYKSSFHDIKYIYNNSNLENIKQDLITLYEKNYKSTHHKTIIVDCHEFELLALIKTKTYLLEMEIDV